MARLFIASPTFCSPTASRPNRRRSRGLARVAAAPPAEVRDLVPLATSAVGGPPGVAWRTGRRLTVAGTEWWRHL